MKTLEAQLVLDDQKNKQTAGNAQREAEHVDQRVIFLAVELAERGEEIVFEHSRFLCIAHSGLPVTAQNNLDFLAGFAYINLEPLTWRIFLWPNH